MCEGQCNCFMCRHGNDKRVLKAYLTGYMEQTESVLNALKEAGITHGFIGDKDPLKRLVGDLKYEKEATGTFLDELNEVEL